MASSNLKLESGFEIPIIGLGTYAVIINATKIY